MNSACNTSISVFIKIQPLQFHHKTAIIKTPKHELQESIPKFSNIEQYTITGISNVFPKELPGSSAYGVEICLLKMSLKSYFLLTSV